MLDVAHGFHVFRDGSAWCAVGPHFIDLMQSDAGFGNTPTDAIIELHCILLKQRWWQNKALPMRDKFTIHPGPNGVRKDCDRYEKCEEGVGQCHCLDEAQEPVNWLKMSGAITGLSEADGMTPSQAFHAGRKSMEPEIERLRAVLRLALDDFEEVFGAGDQDHINLGHWSRKARELLNQQTTTQETKP